MLQKRQAMYNVNIEACSPNYCCCGKVISIAYSECMSVALAMRQVKWMRCIIMQSGVCLALPYFATLSHKWHNFGKHLLNIECVF